MQRAEATPPGSPRSAKVPWGSARGHTAPAGEPECGQSVCGLRTWGPETSTSHQLSQTLPRWCETPQGWVLGPLLIMHLHCSQMC